MDIPKFTLTFTITALLSTNYFIPLAWANDISLPTLQITYVILDILSLFLLPITNCYFFHIHGPLAYLRFSSLFITQIHPRNDAVYLCLCSIYSFFINKLVIMELLVLWWLRSS